MANNLPPDNLRNAWKAQDTQAVKLSVEELRAKAREYSNKVRFLNLVTYVGYAVMAGVYVWLMWHPRGTAAASPNVARVSMSLVIAGICYTVYRLRKQFSAMPIPADSLFSDCLDFYRNQLARRRDYWRTMWWWAMAPIIPGFALWIIANAIKFPERRRVQSLVVFVLMVFFYRAWNGFKHRADALQRKKRRPIVMVLRPLSI
jgi:hypothetical protein